METEIVERVSADVDSSKFLTFPLQAEEYGLEILKVREIMGLMDITTVPQSSDCVRGGIQPAWAGDTCRRPSSQVRY